MARRHEYRIRLIDQRYYVCDLDGSKIGGGFDHQYQAEDARDRLERRARLTTRPCLRCRQPFESQGPHNRMCGPCAGIGARLPAQFLGA